MNKNIFTPIGKIDQNWFLLNYIILITIYLVGGFFLICFIIKHEMSYLFFLLPFLIIKIFLTFNYKKRLMDITEKLWLSIVLGIFFGFDSIILPLIKVIKNFEISLILFWALNVFIIFIQPAIVALIPAKNNKD